MNILKKIRRNFNTEYTLNDKMLFFLGASIYLHFVVTIVMLLVVFIYLWATKQMKSLFQNSFSTRMSTLFTVYLLITSLFFHNWIGALASVGMFILFMCINFYHKNVSKILFEDILDIMILLSIVCVIYAIVEQTIYIHTSEDIVNFFDIDNHPKYRVHTFFLNANYYAFMIMFIQLFCTYKVIIQTKLKYKVYYYSIFVINLLPLFLTGSRTVWFFLLASLITMFIISRKYKELFHTVAALAAISLLTILKLPIIPRLIEYGTSLGRRTAIYRTAQMMLKDVYVFGKGPLTYYTQNHLYLKAYVQKYGSDDLGPLGISSQHAHSMFLEPLISFGAIGTTILCAYLFLIYRETWYIFKNHLNTHLVSLIVGCTVATISNSIIDFPIMWVQTGLIFFITITSAGIYQNEHLNKKKRVF
jgi:O-antigen ligase